MPNSLEEKLYDAIDCITSRAKKDISTVFSQLDSSGCPSLALHNCVLVFYLHIEGVVKGIADKYILYLQDKSKTVQLIPHLHYIVSANNVEDIKWYKRLCMKTKKENDKSCTGKLIDTLNNIDYETLKKILFILNIPETEYIKYKDLLNKLVKTRHDIAHGNISLYYDNIKLSHKMVAEYKDVSLALIELFRNHILDSIDNGSYKLLSCSS